MAMITPLDKIPTNVNNDNIGNDLNDPLVKEVINEIHNSQPIQIPIKENVIPNQPQQIQYQQPIQKSYIDYDILTKSVILSIIAIIVISIIPTEKIMEMLKIDNNYENIVKGGILSIIYYFYNINLI